MITYYAASISISQGKWDTQASCTLLYDDGVHRTMLTLQWPTMPPESDPENAGEWLFRVLEDLVTNFDAHQVMNATHEPTNARPGGPRA